MIEDKVGVFSFFTGAGFLDLGFEKTEKYDTLFVNEYHKPFLDIYIETRKELGIKPPIYGHHNNSIEDFIKGKDFENLKNSAIKAKQNYKYIGFIGGPPCPDFSVAGKNKGHEGENGKLSGTYVDLITKIKPDFFLFENVKGLYRTSKHRAFFESIKEKLTKAGYFLTEKLINAVEYGAPQERERIILIGFQKDVLLQKGIKLNGYKYIKDFNWTKYALYSKGQISSYNWPTTDIFEENSVRPSPINVPVELTVEYWFKKNDVERHPNAKHYFTPRAGLIRFQEIPEGDDAKKSYKRLHRWRYSPTAAYGNNEVHLHPYKPRRITVAEALAIQSLPKEFVIPAHITLTNMFKTIGNGVPYFAAKALAMSISDYLTQLPIKNQSNGKVNSQQHSDIHQPA